MEYKKFCEGVAIKAGHIMKHYFGGSNQISYKGGTEIVTLADKEINQLVIDEVAQSFPTHNVLGEEGDSHHQLSVYAWNTDPIDGTIPYARGIPVSVFSLALLQDGKPIVGCVYHPFLDELYYAEHGKGSYCNGKQMSVSDRTMQDQGFLIGQCMRKGMPYDVKPIRDELFDQDINATDLGTITYMGALIAKGSLDALIFPHTKPYDLPAVKVLVEEAGGQETDLWGHQQRFDAPTQGSIVSNGRVHDTIVALSKKHL